MDSPSTSRNSTSVLLDYQTRKLAMRVLDKCTLESINRDTFYKLHQTIPRVALYTGLSRNDIMEIMEDKDSDIDDEKITENHVFDCVSDEFKERVIANTINEYKMYENKDHTIATLKLALREKILFPFIDNKLSLIINKMRYHVKKSGQATYIVESPDSTMERYVYLKKIKEFRQNQRHIYYVHKIYADRDLYMSKTWKKTKKQPNEEKYVILSAGSAHGFMEESLSIVKVEPKETEEDNGQQFKTWLTINLFPCLPANSIIVIDSDVYRDLQNIPPEGYRMETQFEWLEYKGIPIPSMENITDCAMRDLLKKCRASYADVFAKHGHELLIVPPYSSDFNLIELAWDLIIDKILTAHRGMFFTLAEITKAIFETIAQVQTEGWTKLLQHVLMMEQEFWTKDTRMDHLIRDDI